MKNMQHSIHHFLQELSFEILYFTLEALIYNMASAHLPRFPLKSNLVLQKEKYDFGTLILVHVLGS